MCGRFTGFRQKEELLAYFPIDAAEIEVAANYNVAPSQPIPVIVRRDGRNHLETYHWGLVPFWARDPSVGSRLINARVESLAQKASFKSAFQHRRCLIPADGFYEWTGTKGGRQPLYCFLPDRRPFAFAGLWEQWDDHGRAEAVYRSCTLITREAVGAVRAIHRRMPVILQPDAFARWLDPDLQDPRELMTLLDSHCLTDLTCHPVSTRVNTVRNNDPSNIAPSGGCDRTGD